MSYEEYQKRSFELAKQIGDKMHLAINGFNDCQAFIKLRPEMEKGLITRLEFMLIECCKHRVIEIITMFDEMERLTDENEPDIDQKMSINQVNAQFREAFENMYEKTRLFIEQNKSVLT